MLSSGDFDFILNRTGGLFKDFFRFDVSDPNYRFFLNRFLLDDFQGPEQIQNSLLRNVGNFSYVESPRPSTGSEFDVKKRRELKALQDRFKEQEKQQSTSVSPSPPAATVETISPGNYPPASREKINDAIEKASALYDVPKQVIKAIIEIESDWNPRATGQQTQYGTAYGLMQVMPFHFQPHENPYDVYTNIQRGTSILADRFQKTGDWLKAAAAYFGAYDWKTNSITGARDVTGTSGYTYVNKFINAYNKYR